MLFLLDILRALRRRVVASVLLLITATMAIAAPIAFIGVSEGAKSQIQQDIGKVGTDVIFLTNNTFLESLSTGHRLIEEGDTAALRRIFAGEALRFWPTLIEEVLIDAPGRAKPHNTVVMGTGPEYLDTIEFPLKEGRFLCAEDLSDQAPVCVLDEALGRELFGADQEMMDRRITLLWRGRRLPVTIVGVLEEPFVARKKYQDMDTVRFARFTVARRLEFRNVYVPYTLLLPPDRPPPPAPVEEALAGFVTLVAAPGAPHPELSQRGRQAVIASRTQRDLLAWPDHAGDADWREALGRALVSLVDQGGYQAFVIPMSRLATLPGMSWTGASPRQSPSAIPGEGYMILDTPLLEDETRDGAAKKTPDRELVALLRRHMPDAYLVTGWATEMIAALDKDSGLAPENADETRIVAPLSAERVAEVRGAARLSVRLLAMDPRDLGALDVLRAAMASGAVGSPSDQAASPASQARLLAGRRLSLRDDALAIAACMIDRRLAKRRFGSPQEALERPVEWIRRGRLCRATVAGVFDGDDAPAPDVLLGGARDGLLVVTDGFLERFDRMPEASVTVPEPREEGNAIMIAIDGPLSERWRRYARNADIHPDMAAAMGIPEDSELAPYLEDAAKAIYAQAAERDLKVIPICNFFWVRTLSNFTDVVNIVVAGASGFIILGVAIICVMVINLIIVRGRYREVAIRRCEGARQGHIIAQFVLESLVVSLIAAMFGLGLGVAGGHWLGRGILEIPPSFGWGSLVQAVAFSLVFGVLSTLVPAWRASRVDPMTILHRAN